jgi:hypothetical protein
MSNCRLSVTAHLALGLALLALQSSGPFAQQSFAQTASAVPLISQMTTAFAPKEVIQQVQLAGAATWYAGTLEDSGTVSLTASTNGSSQMQLSLDTLGQRTESQTGAGLNAACQWVGADAVAHNVDSANCLRPAVWFLPALSLQSSLLPSYVCASDLGLGTVGSAQTTYRHLQSELVFSSLSSATAAYIASSSVSDLGLDPVSLFPTVLAYSIHPDGGSPALILVEIRYSQYQLVSGAEIPFHIQRYVNGSLQLDIQISSAQVN